MVANGRNAVTSQLSLCSGGLWVKAGHKREEEQRSRHEFG